jgi:hypothetical protein
MAQQVLGGIAEDLSVEGRDAREAQSTFDRLLRAYFARLLVREFPVMVDRSFEPPSASRNGHSRSDQEHTGRGPLACFRAITRHGCA